MDDGRERPLFPAGVGELAERLDQVRPAGFHRIMLRRAAAMKTSGLAWTGLYTVKVSEGRARFFSATLGLRFEETLTTRQAVALRTLIEGKNRTKVGENAWVRSDAGRRMLWRWRALGVVAG
jgi:hypothetical protein